MRVLLRDQSDNTYIVLDAESVYYDESDQELYVVSENYDYTVHRVVKANADSFIVYGRGVLHLSVLPSSNHPKINNPIWISVG